jgi:hypothetical protein
MTIQTFTAGQKLTALQMNTLQASDFNFTRNVRSEDAYTFQLSDKGKLVESTNAGAAVFTIDNDSSVEFDVGDRIDFLLASTGTLQISPAVGVTLYAEGNLTTITSIWTRATLIKRAANSWIMTGSGMTVQTVELDDDAVTGAKIADNSVTSAHIVNGTIVNEDVSASASISHSKLANATAGQVLLGTTTTGVVTATTISGDISVDGAGVAGISAGVIDNADISPSAAIAQGKIADSSIDEKTASYPLVLTDKNKFIKMNIASSANTVTVPADASVNFPIGSQIHIIQYGTGKTQILPVAGTPTIYATPGQFLRAQYSSATLLKCDTNIWILMGDLSAS